MFYKIMQISPLNFNKLNTLRQTNALNIPVFQKHCACDSVSFTRRSDISHCISQNSKAGIEFGKDLLQNLSKGNNINLAVTKIKENYPDVTCKPIEQLKESQPYDYQKYSAMYVYNISNDFKPDNPRIYINLNSTQKDKQSNFLFVSEIAHEYTHLVQSHDDSYNNEIKEVAGGNKMYADLIGGLGEAIFSYFDNDFQAKTILPTFNREDVMNTRIYGGFLPREAAITKQTLLKKTNYQYESMFNREINKYFDSSFDMYCKYLPYQDDKDVPPEMKKMFQEIVDRGEIEQFKSDVKKMCKIAARKEKEAYATESELGREYLNTTEAINLDVFPIYYDMLENALN